MTRETTLRHGASLRRGDRGSPAWGLLGLGLLAGAAGLLAYEQRTRNSVSYRPPDMAPARAARRGPLSTLRREQAVVGRTVTIGRPRQELYTSWRGFSDLHRLLDHVRSVETDGDVTRWTIDAPTGALEVETRIVEDEPGAFLRWTSTPASDIATRGHVRFRDAPAGRGTEVEAEIAYDPPGGEIGRWAAKALGTEPRLQGRRALKRFKMLMETGEIATNRNRNPA